MITEDYVSYEIAKLLKDKGFDESCLMCYTSDKKLGNYGHYKSCKNSDVFALTAPTIQKAMKWLRKVHNIDISVTPDRKNGYSVLIFKDKRLPFDTLDSYSTYEQVCEVAIKYCLQNLI